jgi:hypothetical protein
VAFTLSAKDLKKHGIEVAAKTKKRRTGVDRMLEAISSGFPCGADSCSLSNGKLFIELNVVSLLSHNDILRINFKQLHRYICLWKERIALSLRALNHDKKKFVFAESVKIEFLYERKTARKLDYDSAVAVTKFIVDGLVEQKVIEDDSDDFLKLILVKQCHGKSDTDNIKLLISPCSESDVDKLFSLELSKLF